MASNQEKVVYAKVDDSRQGCGVGPQTAVPACPHSGPVAGLLTANVDAGTAQAVATHETSNVVLALHHSGPVAGLLTASVEAGTAQAVASHEASHETSTVVQARPRSGPVAGLSTANVEAGTAQAVANHYVTATRKDVQEPETGSDVLCVVVISSGTC